MIICSILMRFLVMSYFLVMKWALSVEILIILTLIILIMMKMILKLLFISDFRLSILNLKNSKHLKWSYGYVACLVNAYSVAF